MNETCFVIMPIGDQEYNEIKYSVEELKKRYDDLIKTALQTARPNLEIYRSDDVSVPGSITNDILTRLMFSKYVIVDISLPNPNVFYELGIRHAIKSGTILIKDKNIKNMVFDISHLRYIEYENTASGLKELATHLAQYFLWMEKNPQKPDNQFIELAGFVKFQYPRFIDLEEQQRKKQQALVALMAPFLQNPELIKIILDPSVDENAKNTKLLDWFKDDPEALIRLLNNMAINGFLQ